MYWGGSVPSPSRNIRTSPLAAFAPTFIAYPLPSFLTFITFAPNLLAIIGVKSLVPET
jgi:hypothetical protein